MNDDVEVPERSGQHDNLVVYRATHGEFGFYRRGGHDQNILARSDGFYRTQEDAVAGARRAFPDIAERVELIGG